jgi:hypothetical protein
MNCPVDKVELDSHIRETSQAAFMVDMIMLSLRQQFHYSNESTCKALVYALTGKKKFLKSESNSGIEPNALNKINNFKGNPQIHKTLQCYKN